MSDLVYTCVFDNYDWVLPPLASHDKTTHVLITDTAGPTPSGWRRHIVDPAHWGGPAAANRYWKMLGHRELRGFARTLYVDANIRLLGDTARFLDTALPDGAAMGLFRHPLRDCVASEAATCIETGKVTDPETVAHELAHYEALGFTDDCGLSENTILARRPDAPGLDDAMQAWWTLYRQFASRDQFSLPVIRWQTDLPVHWIEWSFRAPNSWFAIYPHRKGRNINPYYALAAARAHDSFLHTGILAVWNALRATRRTMKAKLRRAS